MNHKIPILKDTQMRQKFEEDGFVVVPFLTPDQIESLLELYRKFHPEGVKGFYTTTFANNVEHREEVNSAIREMCRPRINELFENFKILFSSYIVKATGKDSELIMHQDMTLVNETIYTGTNIWCPLVDLTENNGTIELLPKSHRLFKTYRGSSIPDIYDGVESEVRKYMQPCQVKAGEAIIFDQSIIHYSPPNLSKHERPVINTFVAHRDARIQICYWDRKQEGKIEIYEQEDNFLEHYENFGSNIFDRPTIGQHLGHFDYDFPKLDKKMIRELYGNTHWIARLFGIKS